MFTDYTMKFLWIRIMGMSFLFLTSVLYSFFDNQVVYKYREIYTMQDLKNNHMVKYNQANSVKHC